MDPASDTSAALSEVEPSSADDPHLIICPVCHDTRRIEHEARFILCGNCLAVLVCVRSKPKAKPSREVRRLTADDLAIMSETELEPLREARNRRLRARLLANWLAQIEV